VSGAKTALVNGDDISRFGAARLLERFPDKTVSFGLDKKNRFRAENISARGSSGGGYAFGFFDGDKKIADARIKLPGEHNVYNALAAAAAARLFGADAAMIEEGLRDFGGVSRRFEFLGFNAGRRVYTDYAHHPSELKTTVKTARATGAKSVTGVFEPHTFSRTKSLADGFCESLAAADRCLLVPIFASREAPIEGVTSQILSDGINNRGGFALNLPSSAAACGYLNADARVGEIIVFAGAGGIDTAAREFARA
jgi:UDP-N-acetylmuramate--alanine ligase